MVVLEEEVVDLADLAVAALEEEAPADHGKKKKGDPYGSPLKILSIEI